MRDLGLAALWCGVLSSALIAGAILHQLGLAATYIRDLLHVGAGIWVVGWPWWEGPALPIAMVVFVAALVAVVPGLRSRHRVADRLHDSVTGGDERWSGLIVYTASYALFTTVGLLGDPLPAAAGLLALSLGDGIGGAFGRRFGRHYFRSPGGKRKTIEGSLAVALMAMLGAVVAGGILGAPVGASRAILAGLVAALAEAAAPRGTDNAAVPASVWLTLILTG